MLILCDLLRWHFSLRLTLPFSTMVELRLPFHDGLVIASGQNLASCIGYEDSVFKLGTSLAVCGNCRPIVSPGGILIGAQINHRFHSKNMALLHNTLGLVLVVVRHIRGRVEKRSDSMATIRPIYSTSIRHGCFMDNTSKVAIQRTRLDHGESRRQAIKRRFDQSFAILVHISNTKCFYMRCVIWVRRKQNKLIKWK